MEITNRIVGVAIESFFKTPLLFNKELQQDTASKCLEAFSSYGLKPTQISLRCGDIGYNYDLSFSLFNGNATFKFGCEKIELNFQNATNDRDFEVVADCILKVYDHVQFPSLSNTLITASAHTATPSGEAFKTYMARFTDPAKQIIQGGIIIHTICRGWDQEIRMTAEKSVVVSDGIFLTWLSSFPEKKLSRAVLDALSAACDEAAAKIGLTFPQKTS